MAAPQFIKKTNNLVADLKQIVDPSWEIVGQTPDGMPVYKSMEQRPRVVPDINPDTGFQRTRDNSINGLPLYKLNRVVIEEFPFVFTLYDARNGNVRREPYVQPSAAELRERDIAARKHTLMAGLIHAMAEANVTPEELVSAVKRGGQARVPAPTAYPENYAPGRWRLSDGSTMQGTREEAERAESAFAEPDDIVVE